MEATQNKKTYEGSFIIKWYPNCNGDKRPLTIDCDNLTELRNEQSRISDAFINEGEVYYPHGKPQKRFAYSVKFELSERK